MRLLILTDRFPPEERGGAERIACYQAHAFRNAGWTVGVVTGTSGVELSGAKEREGLQIFPSYRFPETRLGFYRIAATGAVYNPLAVAAARRAVAAFRPDVIHCHLAASMSLASLAQFADEYPTVVTFHGYQFECAKGGLYRKRGQLCAKKPRPCRLYSRYNSRLLMRVRRFIAISRFIESRLLETGFDRKRVSYVPNGLPGVEERVPAPLPAERSILYVGQLEAHKGVCTLVRAFHQVPDLSASLTIVGDGRQSNALQELAAHDRRIRILGRLPHEQVQEQYRSHRIVVVPSLWHEVMNTVICEAQSWGRPVVATPLGGNCDLIEGEVSGLFVPPGDEVALAAALSRLFDDDNLAQRLAAGGHTQVKRFNMNRHFNELIAVYRELNGGR